MLRKQVLITVVLSAILVLLSVSSFRTIDPVSKLGMGTFKFGRREIINMARFDWPLFPFGYGRDQLVYNFEFTQFHYLTEKIVNTVGLTKVFVIAEGATWISDLDFFDISTSHRAIDGDHLRPRSLLFSNFISDNRTVPEEIYYISYPNKDKDNVNMNERDRLSRSYDIEGIIPVEKDGYSIDVYHYVKKDP